MLSSVGSCFTCSLLVEFSSTSSDLVVSLEKNISKFSFFSHCTKFKVPPSYVSQNFCLKKSIKKKLIKGLGEIHQSFKFYEGKEMHTHRLKRERKVFFVILDPVRDVKELIHDEKSLIALKWRKIVTKNANCLLTFEIDFRCGKICVITNPRTSYSTTRCSITQLKMAPGRGISWNCSPRHLVSNTKSFMRQHQLNEETNPDSR